jgi:hypothetical protein
MILKHLKGHKKQFKKFGLISETFFKSHEKKLKLTPSVFGRFWAVFNFLKIVQIDNYIIYVQL